MLRLLFLGDIIGEPGRRAVIEMLPTLKSAWELDFVVVNGENVAAGRGITPKLAIDLLRCGAAVITTGDHVWDQKDSVSFIDTAKGKVGVINVQGRTFMLPALENPFRRVWDEVEQIRAQTPVIFVDVHAETTSEKIALGRFLDGKVSVVAGTHTHVQTADDQIFPGGTAFICDAGMCGPTESVLGREIQPIVQRFYTSMPVNFPVAKGEVKLHGLIVDIDEESGRAMSVQRVAETYRPAPAESPATQE